ncbi:MAG: 2Fe-2S iron-sulfur cluster binding domain-containing protein [Pseudobacteriovorax sp.]|nr:2Fe-2S iron-sulfur cluster binding domain-containing protein [Pseudobacteriovorax sp.]
MVTVRVNGETKQLDVEAEKPLLWTLREDAEILGPKFGCGYGACGACTVHVEGVGVRSCIYRTESAAGKEVTTIEGLNSPIGQALKTAWESIQVPQCGYCQPGMIMAFASAIQSQQTPDVDSVLQEVTNLCRCGTYDEIRSAVAVALNELRKGASQ